MSEFNPDEYLKEAVGDGEFNPDKYLAENRDVGKLESGARGLAQGATFGWADEIAGAVESALTDKTYEQARDESRANFKRAKETNPKTFLAGELGGGVASTLLPGMAAVKGLGGAMRVGATVGALSGAGNSEAENAEGLLADTAMGSAIGTGGGALGYGAAKGLEKGANLISKKLAPGIAKMLPVGKKDNAKEIEAAAKALGIKPTAGMTNASETVQKLESSLHQAPTIGGYLTRRSTKPVIEAMESATDDLTKGAATVSPFESGDQVKKILAKEIEGKFKPSTDVFNDLAQYTKDIPIPKSSINRVSKNIMKIPEVDTLELPLAKQVVRQLEKEPSVDTIKTLRTMVGKKASSAADGAERSAYWQIYAKLGRLEENSLKRGVIASARNQKEGEKIAGGMLNQLKGAKKGYSTQMTNLEDLAGAARLGRVSGPGGFVDKIDSIPSERLQEKLLPLEDVRLAQTVQKQFPEAFGGLKAARLRDLSDNIHVDGETLPGRFLNNTKGLNPEAKTMLFGDQAPKLDALRTVNQSLPDKVGPSGTQQALDVASMLNPWTQGRDLARFGAYKYASSDKLAKLGEYLRTRPQFKNMAEKNPKAFQAMVYDLSKRMSPEGGISRAAGFTPEKPQSDEESKAAFVEGN